MVKIVVDIVGFHLGTSINYVTGSGVEGGLKEMLRFATMGRGGVELLYVQFWLLEMQSSGKKLKNEIVYYLNREDSVVFISSSAS